MTLPRSAYCRFLAREAGRRLYRAMHADRVRCYRDGEPRGDWLFDVNGDRQWQIHLHYEREAYRWSTVPWCPVGLGKAAEAGRLTMLAALSYVAIPLLVIVGVGTGVAIVMGAGAMFWLAAAS